MKRIIGPLIVCAVAATQFGCAAPSQSRATKASASDEEPSHPLVAPSDISDPKVLISLPQPRDVASLSDPFRLDFTNRSPDIPDRGELVVSCKAQSNKGEDIALTFRPDITVDLLNTNSIIVESYSALWYKVPFYLRAMLGASMRGTGVWDMALFDATVLPESTNAPSQLSNCVRIPVVLP